MSTAPTRGRKRFRLDLQNASELVSQGVEVQGLRISTVKPGTEDGSFDCSFTRTGDHRVATFAILVSDESEYPSDHTFFCSSQEELPAYVLRVAESIHEYGPLTIQDLLMRLLEKLVKGAANTRHRIHGENDSDSEIEDVDDDETDTEDYDDEDFGMMTVESGHSKLDRSILQRDFTEIVAYGYRPGFIPFGIDDFALSVSLPVKSLVDIIPARALMAWDKQLLSRPQHLSLLISGLRGLYPIIERDATYTHSAHFHGAVPQFRVGLTSGYKPTQEDASDTLRKYGLKEEYNAQPETDEDFEDALFDDSDEEFEDIQNVEPDQAEPEATTGFRPISLSSSLESLLNGHFLRILQLRIQYDLGWAGAETLCWEVETSQQSPGDIMRLRGHYIRNADSADELLSESYILPADPLLQRDADDSMNLPLLAFSYLMRRITLCPRYCLVCHQQLKEDLEALKPYVCSSKLCTYQYYNLNRGPSLEYEICANPASVDLLVSLAYIAAAEGGSEAPMPTGMGLRVKYGSELHDFDKLQPPQMRSSLVQLINTLPAVADIKKFLEQPPKPGRTKPRLQDMDKSISEAAWAVLRWCVASCTAHIEELKDEGEQVKNIGPEWRQFRFSVGAPDAEAKFRTAVQKAQEENQRAKQFPSLYAFHGSPALNWHSIIRHGLWYKNVVHGRAYGNGVYFAKDGSVSTSAYARAAQSCWINSSCRVTSCVALAEIVNHPAKFVSTNPFFVVAQVDWIICRYLMVRGSGSGPSDSTVAPTLWPGGIMPTDHTPATPVPDGFTDETIPFVPLDPHHPLTLAQKAIRIPEPMHALERILAQRREEYISVDYDEDDLRIFDALPPVPFASETESAITTPLPDDWKHDREWVDECIQHLIPPPTESSVQATMALQKEMRMVLKEQNAAKSLRELGWYMPEDLIGDNLYQWIMELHSFDSELPIARDLEKRGVNSLVFEVRFPATFPHAPPFFRILKPRFLPFSQGGGGHVTLGGSMCMDLLTSDGWLPSYSISAILLQIKLAISNLDPKPARLASNWDLPYGMQEALEGYKRAANVHGWKIPKDVDRLARV